MTLLLGANGGAGAEIGPGAYEGVGAATGRAGDMGAERGDNDGE